MILGDFAIWKFQDLCIIFLCGIYVDEYKWYFQMRIDVLEKCVKNVSRRKFWWIEHLFPSPITDRLVFHVMLCIPLWIIFISWKKDVHVAWSVRAWRPSPPPTSVLLHSSSVHRAFPEGPWALSHGPDATWASLAACLPGYCQAQDLDIYMHLEFCLRLVIYCTFGECNHRQNVSLQMDIL